MRTTPFLFVALASAIAAQSPPEGYTRLGSSLNFFAQRVMIGDNIAFEFDGRSMFARQLEPVRSNRVLEFPEPVVAKFMAEVDFAIVALGVSPGDEIWVVGPTPAIIPRLAGTLPGMRDATRYDPTRILVSVAQGTGSAVVAFDLVSGAATTVVALDGPPGPIDMNHYGLWVAELDASDPTAPGSADLLMFPAQNIRGRVDGFSRIQTPRDALLRAPDQNPPLALAGDHDNDVFVIDPLDGNVYEISFDTAPSPAYFGRRLWLDFTFSRRRATDVQFLGPVLRRTRDPEFEAFHRGTDLRLVVHEGEASRTLSVNEYGAFRPTLGVPLTPPAGTFFEMFIQSGGPRSGIGFLALTPGRLFQESPVRMPGFEEGLIFQSRLLAAPIFPVQFSAGGGTSVTLYNPGFGASPFTALAQCAFIDAAGVTLGASSAVEFVLR